MRTGKTIQVTDMPLRTGRAGVTVTTRGRHVLLRLTGARPAGPVLFQLPAFVHNIAAASAGRVEPATGTVRLPASARAVVVTLRHGA